MTALHQVVKSWLHMKEDWLQQAAELILSKGALDNNDINILAEYLKTTEGQEVTTIRGFPELGSTHTLAEEVRVKSISEIVGIENLNPRIPLEFGEGNLCVIYGHNGSGKSGYTRLLKKAAGKSAKDLKHNIFQPPPVQRKAKIIFALGEKEHQHEWLANSVAIPALQAVDIFDTDTAINYLARDNEATYAPPLVSLFGKLVDAATRVKGQLEIQANFPKTLPLLLSAYGQSKSGTLYNNLKANSDVQKIAIWAKEDERALAQLTARLATADPAALAKQKRANKDQIQQLVATIKSAAAAYTDEALQAIQSKRQNVLEKRKIAQEASLVQSAKLEGVGSVTWKALWEAARTYSQTAYPQCNFPVTDSALCLFCQQPLDDEARQRLQNFEKFVQGNIEQAAATAEREYKVVLNNLPIAPDEHKLIQDCQSAALNDEALLKGIKGFWKVITATRTVILAGNDGVAILGPVTIIDTLEAIANALEAEAKQYAQDAASFDRAKATQEKFELDAKKWVSAQATAIDAEIQRLKEIAKYDGWIKRAGTTHITQKGSEIAEAAITDAYIARFTAELEHLKAQRIKVQIVKTKASKGKAFHGIKLKGSEDGSAKPDEILSEGERRIVSLAAFLADVAEKPNAATFIFDDPISSLDQDFELVVASRLVQLAKTRQVLVFTHRTSFLVAIEDTAGKMGKDHVKPNKDWKEMQLSQRWIQSFNGFSGQISGEEVRNAPSTIDAIKVLEKKLASAKLLEIDAYKAVASGLCSELRILLERMVEEDLLNKVVLRQRRSVTTDNRLSVLSNITPQDCKQFDDLMTKYSALVHSQSVETPLELPDADDIAKDVNELKTWREGYKKRPDIGAPNA